MSGIMGSVRTCRERQRGQKDHGRSGTRASEVVLESRHKRVAESSCKCEMQAS